MAVCDIKRDVWFIIVRLYQKDGVEDGVRAE